jgi:hypothetical protein
VWQINNGPLSAEQDNGDLSLFELMRTISRNFILAVGGIYLVFLIATVFHSEENFTINVWIVLPLFVILFYLSLRFQPSYPFLTHTIWYVGLAATISIEFYLSHEPEVLFMFIAIPFFVVLSLGRLAGFVSLSGMKV